MRPRRIYHHFEQGNNQKRMPPLLLHLYNRLSTDAAHSEDEGRAVNVSKISEIIEMVCSRCRRGSDPKYADCKLLFNCRSCRLVVSRRELVIRHVGHDYRPDSTSVDLLAGKVDSYFKEKMMETIREIQMAQSNFLSRVEKIVDVMEVSHRSILFGQLWKARVGMTLIDITNSVMNSWRRQEEDCWSYLMRCEQNYFASKSLREISDAVAQINKDWEKMKNVERCDVDIQLETGQITLSPSPKNTTVSADGSSFANECNTCSVRVRDMLGGTVQDGVEYEISVVMADPEGVGLDITIENKKNGLFCVKYFPTSSGWHSISVTLDSKPIRNSFLDIDVKESRRPTVTVIGEPGTEPSQFFRPWGVCTDDYGRIYVSDRNNNRIQVFDAKGKFMRAFGKAGSGPGELKLPAGIAADGYQRIIVADKDNHRIQIFLSNGKYVSHFGRFDSEERSLHYPWGVAVDGENRIAVTEGLKRRVRLFNDDGVELAVCTFTREMELDFPRGICSMPNGKFLVTDFNKNKIVLLDDELNAVSTLGCSGKGFNQFFRPQGIAVSRDGLLAVSDSRNNCIKIFRENTLDRIVSEDFECIQDLVFHPNGSLLVIDKEKCHMKILRYESTIWESGGF